MRPKSMISVMVCVLIVGGAAMLAAPAQTQQPGQMTQARVRVENRGRSEAIPVDLRDANMDNPLRVRIVNGETPQVTPIIVRVTVPLWDYKSITVMPGTDMAAALRSDGSAGWETTGIAYTDANGTTILLKRPR